MLSLDTLIEKIAKLVTENGPIVLVPGVSNYDAHVAILACLEKLIDDRKNMVPLSVVQKMEGLLKEEEARRREVEGQLAKELADKVLNNLGG